jgi:hypothetical protein
MCFISRSIFSTFVLYPAKRSEGMNKRVVGASAAIASAGLLAWTGWGAYVNRTTERVPYTEIGRAGDVEFREYPETVLVRTHAASEEAAFGRLFEYIGGANRASEAVEMTAPIATDGERTPANASDEAGDGTNGTSEAVGSEDVAMTAPVRTDQGDGAVRMEFFLPAEYTPESAPRPTDPRVELLIRPARTVAALAFAGYARDRKIEKRDSELLETLEQAGIEPIDEPVLLQYNDPYTPPFMRHNEVCIEVVAEDVRAARNAEDGEVENA